MPGQYASNPTVNPITVDYLLKYPQVLDRRFKKDLSQMGYISEVLLQGGYPVVGGALRYNRDEADQSGLFPDREGGRRTYEIVAEAARFPIIGPTEPTEQIAKSAKHGLRMFVTWEQMKRNMLPQVDKNLRQLKNELINYVDGLFMAQFKADTVINTTGTFGSLTQRTRNVTTAPYNGVWDAANLAAGGFLKDIARAKAEITSLRLGFQPDTILLHDNGAASLQSSDKLLSYFAQAENRAPIFTGQLPGQLWGMDILYSPFVTPGDAYVLQRKAIGGYGDERPESIKVLPFDEGNETQEIKASRVMLYFIDEPKAVIKLTGLGPLF